LVFRCVCFLPVNHSKQQPGWQVGLPNGDFMVLLENDGQLISTPRFYS
jgi:hypothetical protein